MARLFDNIVMIDWSAASRPRRGRDSIWAASLNGISHPIDAKNWSTRREAEWKITEILDTAQQNGHRTLIGFDFPFGYPTGLAAQLDLKGAAWRAIWQEYERLIHDDERNKNNRFVVAKDLNRRISGDRKFPFWGCPASQEGPHLSAKHHRLHNDKGLDEKRLVDRCATSAQPGWKLFGNGSAGSQALTGIPVLERLKRRFSALRVWPFETGLAPPALDAGGAVLVEIYPSLFTRCPPPHGQVKDEHQMLKTVARFADLDARDKLAALFDPALNAEQREIVQAEEGWVLGVTGPVPVPEKVAATDG